VHFLAININLVFEELQCSMAQLALAWVAKVNPYTSTVILGATKPEQVIENLGAIDVLPKLTPEIMEKIEKVLDNKPSPIVSDRLFLLGPAPPLLC
jgi:aryl-alcohol dehydrogenase-like predicted oxidoreductase